MAGAPSTAPDIPLEDAWDRLWASMRYARVPGLPDFASQYVFWLFLPAIVFWSFFFIPLLLSRRFTWLQGKGKYVQFLLLLWGASYFLPALIFLSRHSYGTFCDLYNRYVTPQLMYTDAFAVCIIMTLHMIIEQADMRTGAHATGSLFTATMIPYPIFLYHLTKLEHKGYRVTGNQRWARWLYLLFGVITLLIWIVPLVSFWNTFQTLDLRHSGVGVSPDHASAWATGVVTVGWVMFAVWSTPQFKHWFWSYLFTVIAITHLAFAMGLFLFVRLSPALAEIFLVSPAFPATSGLLVPHLAVQTVEPSPRGGSSARRSAIASPPTSGRSTSPNASRRTPRRTIQ